MCIRDSITIADRFFESYRRNPDFIQLYIFPGGMLPSPSALNQEYRQAGLAERAVHCFGQDLSLIHI